MTKKGHIRKKRRRVVKTRLFSLLFTIGIVITLGYFFWQTRRPHLPNLHGWAATEVMAFGDRHHINVQFEFVYAEDVAPTLVVSQSLPPRTRLVAGLNLVIEISKGIEVR
ncbi:MAG: hypothetical protein FWG67_09700 [Defluviitaleaceae bacterium]|nr:hypothetical protein [Defluviitaleaceae bacterium]